MVMVYIWQRTCSGTLIRRSIIGWREFWHGDDIQALANKVSEMIDHQKQNKV